VIACLLFTSLHYAYVVHVLFLHMDTRRRRRPYGAAVGGRQTSCRRLYRLPPRRLHGNTETQLVHVPSSAAALGITTDAQVVQMQVGTVRVTALPVPTRSRERVARAVGRGVAGADVEQGARRASRWSWPQLCTSLERRASWCTSHRRRRRRVSRPSRSWYRCRWGRCT